MDCGEDVFMDRPQQEDEQRLREALCERRSVGICCDESSHAEAVDPWLRPFHTVSRDCMKSSWRSPDGGSSVARNTKIEPCGAVFCAWSGTATPIRSFYTVSLRGWVNRAPSETVGDLLHGRGSGAPRAGTQGIVQATFGKEIP